MQQFDVNVVLIDIGSTIIKVAKFNGKEKVLTFEKRDINKPVGEQVSKLIEWEIKRDKDVRFRICSSANGGLRVGIIALTMRYSGEVSKRIALSSGCNVIWIKSKISEPIPEDKVDVIIVAGGLTINNCISQENWIKSVVAQLPNEIPIIFSGNNQLAGLLLSKRKDGIILNTILLEDMRIDASELSKTLKELYMQDLVQKDGVSMLQSFSEIPIWPTPAICELAFRCIMENRTHFHVAHPLLMVDIGGATTDIYYGRELIDDLNELNVEALPINRFVFSSIGVKSSMDSTLMKLSTFDRLYDLISTFSPDDAKKKFAELRDNNLSWIGEKEMFYLCFGLVLSEMQKGKESGHPLSLYKVSTVIITGGASKVCDSNVIEMIYSLFTKIGDYPAPNIFIDSDYEIWTVGIASI
jgi:hypothetical protein